MVRFSDMLGGDGDPDDARATTAARDLPPLTDDEPPDPDAPPADQAPTAEAGAEPASAAPSPQDVLERLTQYATATRATPPPAEPQSAPRPEPAAPTAPTASPPTGDDPGDDLLPRAKRSLRNPRGKRRDS
jgi:hypothetical protein